MLGIDLFIFDGSRSAGYVLSAAGVARRVVGCRVPSAGSYSLLLLHKPLCTNVSNTLHPFLKACRRPSNFKTRRPWARRAHVLPGSGADGATSPAGVILRLLLTSSCFEARQSWGEGVESQPALRAVLPARPTTRGSGLRGDLLLGRGLIASYSSWCVLPPYLPHLSAGLPADPTPAASLRGMGEAKDAFVEAWHFLRTNDWKQSFRSAFRRKYWGTCFSHVSYRLFLGGTDLTSRPHPQRQATGSSSRSSSPPPSSCPSTKRRSCAGSCRGNPRFRAGGRAGSWSWGCLFCSPCRRW